MSPRSAGAPSNVWIPTAWKPAPRFPLSLEPERAMRLATILFEAALDDHVQRTEIYHNSVGLVLR